MEFKDLLKYISEAETTAEKDENAEKAGKEVTQDIEYDDKENKKKPQKKSLKDWMELVDKQQLQESEEIQVVPAKQSTQVIKKGNETLGTVTNPALASNIKTALSKGEMNLAGTDIKEEEVEESGLQAYLGKKKYGKAGMKALQRAGREGASKETMAKIRAKHDKLDEVQVDEKAVSKKQQKFMGMVRAAQKGEKAASPEVAKVAKSMKKGDVKDFAKTKHKGLPEKKKKTNEAERPSDQMDMGAGLGAGRSQTTLEAKGKKPDFLDLDNDGNKKETMKKAAADKKKKKLDEAMNTLEAAYHEGKSHGLSKHGYSCRYNEGSEEHKRYHKGFVEGLDECYGMGIRNKPIIGIGETTPPATVPGMASAAMPNPPAMEADVGEGNAFTGKLASTPKGGSFELDGKTFKDTSNLEEFAFESLDKQLNDLLNEGVSLNMTQGIGGDHGQGSDSVTVTATDDDAGKLLAFIKQVGLGGLGGAEEGLAPGEPAVAVVSDYGAPKFAGHDNPDMKSLLQKVGVDDGEDYKHEEGEATCEVCGEASCGCDKGKEVVDEVETEDQMAAEVAETDGDSGDSGEIEIGKSEAEEDKALAQAASKSDTITTNEGGDGGEASEETVDNSPGKGESSVSDEQEELNEWANNAGQKGTDTAFEQDIEFMTKVISGGLNKPKSTGQTTIPVIAGQEARTGDEDVIAWKRLAGLLK